MLRVENQPLEPASQTYLDTKQDEIHSIQNYSERVEEAKTKWKGKNKTHFTAIRNKLEEMCPGHNRCVYCEDSAADEVEHIQAKTIYPNLTFSWENYIFSCGPCNGPKGNSYAVIDNGNNFVEGNRKKGDAVVPPPEGDEGFINPRRYIPTDYLILDLSTFLFVEHPAMHGNQRKMAEYTIRILHLNDRGYLTKNRNIAYEQFCYALRLYVEEKNRGVDQEALNKIISTIKNSPHQTVWFEMKRQRLLHPNLVELFSEAQELI